MKFLKTFLLSLTLLLSAGAFAQNAAVKAVLLDESNGDPVGFATVSLTRSGETQPTKYTLSDEDGRVELTAVRRGTYTFKAELLGYKTYSVELKVENSEIDLGEIKMPLDNEQLEAAKISAVGNPVVIKKDTIEYSATSFRTTDNDVLEDLLKKLPGVEVSDDGSITVNGESISKITIDGKTFFLDDPQLASKNIPAKMVNKLKVIKKKSEQAEFTGIDDGEEETVIDLSVQPGMMKGLFGNVLGGVGYDVPSQDGVDAELRYQGNAFIGRFSDKSQVSVILNGNNVNNQGATNFAGNMMREMRGGMGGSGEGITTSYMAGANGVFDLFDDKMELGGNYLYNKSINDVTQSSVRKTYLDDYNLTYNSSGASNTTSGGHRVGIRMEHKFSDNTSILFEPQINFGTGSYIQATTDTTYNDSLGSNPVSNSFTNNSGSNQNLSASGFLLFRQRLGIPGRTLSVMANFSVSNNELNGINNNGTYSYENADNILTSEEIVNQSFNNTQNSYSLSGRAVYTEPLGNHFYLEANYSYSWSKSTSDKATYDVDTGEFSYEYSNNIINEYNRQEIGLNVLFQNTKLRAQVGFTAMPTNTYNSTTRYNSETGEYSPEEYDDFRWNFSPQVFITADFSDYARLRMVYRGTSSQPSTSELMPVPDNSDPMDVSFGNPSLKPYFTHTVRMDYRFSNREKFSTVNVRFNGNYVQTPIVNALWYGTNGAQYSMPFNGPDSFNMNLFTFANIPIGDGTFSFNNFLNGSYSNSSSYVGSDIDMSVYEDEGYYTFMDQFIESFGDSDWYNEHITENTTRTLNVNERLRFMYRGTALEATLGASTSVNRSWYSIATVTDNTTTWNNKATGSVTWNWTAIGFSLKGEYNFNWYNGYSTPQDSEHVLNAEISKTLFNNAITLAVRGYDILGQAKNLTVTDSSNYHSEVLSNTLGRYIIVSLTWRFGTMGGQRAGRGGPGGPGGGPGGPPPRG